MIVWVLFWIFMHQRSAEERRHDMSCRSRNIGHSHSGPVSSLSGLFKSSLCFCSVMCAYHCSDFSLAGGRTFQGNGWPRITHTHTHTHRCRMTEGVRSSTLSLPKRSVKLLFPNRHMTFQAEKLRHTHTHTRCTVHAAVIAAHMTIISRTHDSVRPPQLLCVSIVNQTNCYFHPTIFNDLSRAQCKKRTATNDGLLIHLLGITVSDVNNSFKCFKIYF